MASQVDKSTVEVLLPAMNSIISFDPNRIKYDQKDCATFLLGTLMS